MTFHASAGKKSPVRVHMLVIWLAELKAKPDANHANAHPMQDRSCQIFNQHRAPSPRSQNWFQIRHHQDKSSMNGHREFYSHHDGAPAF
jgi:hypothetical protein